MVTTHKMREDSTQRQGLLNLCYSAKSYIGDNNAQLIEIGSYCGESGEIIAGIFPNSTLNCVDPWEKYTEDDYTWDLDEQEAELNQAEQIFDSVLARCPNMRKNKMPSAQYVASLAPESIDFVYIDGNHQYSSVKEDLTNYFEKVKVGGIIAGHDYPFPPIQKALSEFFNEEPKGVFGDGSWFYIKE
jgi:predicted O-methyltransferase YrrM